MVAIDKEVHGDEEIQGTSERKRGNTGTVVNLRDAAADATGATGGTSVTRSEAMDAIYLNEDEKKPSDTPSGVGGEEVDGGQRHAIPQTPTGQSGRDSTSTPTHSTEPRSQGDNNGSGSPDISVGAERTRGGLKGTVNFLGRAFMSAAVGYGFRAALIGGLASVGVATLPSVILAAAATNFVLTTIKFARSKDEKLFSSRFAASAALGMVTSAILSPAFIYGVPAISDFFQNTEYGQSMVDGTKMIVESLSEGAKEFAAIPVIGVVVEGAIEGLSTAIRPMATDAMEAAGNLFDSIDKEAAPFVNQVQEALGLASPDATAPDVIAPAEPDATAPAEPDATAPAAIAPDASASQASDVVSSMSAKDFAAELLANVEGIDTNNPAYQGIMLRIASESVETQSQALKDLADGLMNGRWGLPGEGNLDVIKQLITEAQKLDPGNDQVANFLGYMLLHGEGFKPDYEQARALFEQGAASNVGNVAEEAKKALEYMDTMGLGAGEPVAPATPAAPVTTPSVASQSLRIPSGMVVA